MIKIDNDNIGNVADMVHNPQHYKLFPDTEVDAAIRKMLTTTELIGAYKYQIIAYRLRAGKKDNALQDLAKAAKLEEWLWELY